MFHLGARGLRLQTGPFVFCVQSHLEEVAAGLVEVYSDFSVVTSETFADFHITLRSAPGVRRFIRPQSIFEFDGNEPFKPLARSQAFALLEWGMNWCIYTHVHAFLVIHGAVLERHGLALIMPAPSGSGKSTLCGALMSKGWRLLSDELILIDPNNGRVHPLARPVSLKNRSIDVLRSFAPNFLITDPIRDTAKGSVAHMKPSADSVARSSETVLPAWAIFPRYCEGAAATFESVGKSELLMRLIDNAFNYSVLRENGFSMLTAMVSRIDGFDASYGDLDEVVLMIEKLAEESRDRSD